MSLKDYFLGLTSKPSLDSERAAEIRENMTSINMSFESFLVENDQLNNSYSTQWVEDEIKKSGTYFLREIYSKE
ncbi:hypothetical protein [Pseudomonas sp. Irchel s3h9]|uniref:hypothetical protein n=1 Tax=Pseudomonas sp. Irchel s3h9 TaxID=2009192 RepID=UPI000BA3C151|nr:hypothetical protein [Pseudomonas sp. Irchel s3h9]